MNAPLDLNRLARGLMREETRQLSRVQSSELVNRLGDFLSGKFKMPFMQTAGLRDPQIAKARQQLTDFLDANYNRFDLQTVMSKKQSKVGMKAIDKAFYWAPLEIGHERKDGEAFTFDGLDRELVGFKETPFLLFYQRHAVSKLLCTVDEVYQRVTVSEHALYRMIDRGLCEREPLKMLSDHLVMWLPWVNAFNLLNIKGGFIPMIQGGLCLQSYLIEEQTNDPNFELHDRRRFAVMRGGLYLNHLNSPDLAKRAHPRNLRGWTDYRITTYMSNDMLRSERLWAREAMMDFYFKWKDEMLLMMNMNTDLDMDPKTCEFLSNEFTDFRVALKKLLTNPRFTAACKVVSLS